MFPKNETVKSQTLRKYSSGEHAFLPNEGERKAIKESNNDFGGTK